MALIVFTTGHTRKVSTETGKRILRCKKGELKPRTEAQKRYIAHVRGVFLNVHPNATDAQQLSLLK